MPDIKKFNLEGIIAWFKELFAIINEFLTRIGIDY